MKEMTDEELTDRLVEICESADRAACPYRTEEEIQIDKPYVRDMATPKNMDHMIMMTDEKSGEIVAFISILRTYIVLLFVHADYRGKGYGKALIRDAIADFNVEIVFVEELNVQALGFYEKMGFVVTRTTEPSEFPTTHSPVLELRLANPRNRVVPVVLDERDRYWDLLKKGSLTNDRVDQYLPQSDMFVLERDGKVIGEIVVDPDGMIRNFIVLREFHDAWCREYLLYFLERHYRGKFRWLRIGVSGNEAPFYLKRGFKRERTEKDYFIRSWGYSVKRQRYSVNDLIYMKWKIPK